MKLNATQKNLLFAAGTMAVSAAGPIGPLSVFGLIAQPALAATCWTKGRKGLAKVGQASLGLVLSTLAIGFGGMMNPTLDSQTKVVEAPAPVEKVAEAPAPAKPVVKEPVAEAPAPKAAAPAPATKTYEYPTVQAARQEICDAGTQYLMDVAQGYMTVEQGKNEVRSYAAYLSKNSPASAGDLVSIGVGCSKLWN